MKTQHTTASPLAFQKQLIATLNGAHAVNHRAVKSVITPLSRPTTY